MSTRALEDRIEAIVREHDVAFAVLHGSFAEGRETPVSDVDVAVHVESNDTFLDVVVALEEAISDRRVDVMNLARQPARVAYQALAAGVLVHVADESLLKRKRFEWMRDYLDFKPVHDRILADMNRRIDDDTYGRPVE